ncbi:drug/metabolite transporter (DMT)-like permease [Shimia abyssi]|uniref:Drug/metabolite transporter (DMT)-like permease n=2 Tax=Shimia abyssi TaxID=1662395 RepID=A0A2P8FJF6_9RHOB|nr:drug/metabolite transporter (DMT)-like permease [Shimia abyssi]
MGVLLFMGAGWGLTQPLTKIAVSTGYEPLGLIFWQLVIGAVAMGILRLVQGKPLAMPRRLWWFFLMIALLGTVLPNSFSFRAAAHLPAGIMSMVISLVPMFAFPIALVLGIDRFNWLRLGGLVTGLIGVTILAEPSALPDAAMIIWLPVAVVAPLCYGLEGNVVSKWGTHGLGPGHVLFGASVMGAIVALPLAIGSGQFIDPRLTWGAPELALVASSLIHVTVYTSYVWLVSRAGSVFAAQVAYVVTGTGVLWSMLLLGERYSLWVWAAMGLILVGLFLVQPRSQDRVAP